VGFELFLYLFYSCANGNLCIYIFILFPFGFLYSEHACVRRALVKNVTTLFYYVAFMDFLEILFWYLIYAVRIYCYCRNSASILWELIFYC